MTPLKQLTKQQTVTIKTIAREAGVSPATVSRVVTDSPGVSEPLRRRIKRLLAERGYQPNANARSLVKQTARAIGILVPPRLDTFFENPFFAEVIMGAGETAGNAGYDLILYTGRGQREKEKGEQAEKNHLDFLRERRVDGMLLVGTRKHDRYAETLEERMPVVLVNRQPAGGNLSFVSADNRRGAYEAVHHLIALGHRRIGLISGPAEVEISNERLQGYLDALTEAGILGREEWVVEGDFAESGGWRGALALLRLAERPTAIFAANDLMAIGALRAIREEGLRVPEDLSLVGFDNIHSTLHTEPPLTTIKLPAFRMGVLATQLLLSLLRGERLASRQLFVPTELVVRRSTAPPGTPAL